MGKAENMIEPIVDSVKIPTIEPDLQSLSQLYSFRRPAEVSQFLEAYPFLDLLLLEAHDKITEYFGLEPDVILEVVTDLEAIDDRELFAFIRTTLPPDEVLSTLDRFDKEWWLDEADRAEGKLCIHVELE
jgi:hypothetical protein